MTRMTVEAILGGPARDERTVADELPDEERQLGLWRLRHDEELERHLVNVRSKAFNGLDGPVHTTWEWWRSDDTEIAVEFDEAGRVGCIHVSKTGAPQVGPWTGFAARLSGPPPRHTAAASRRRHTAPTPPPRRRVTPPTLERVANFSRLAL
jgi:hypothetical protein